MHGCAACLCCCSPVAYLTVCPAPGHAVGQMYAFCNADDISWGTKNLDTKHADHDAKKMASKALAYQVRWLAGLQSAACCVRSFKP